MALTLESTAALRSIVASMGNKFAVGTGYLPRPAATIDQGSGITGLMGIANVIALSAWVAVGLKARLKATAVATKPLDRG